MSYDNLSMTTGILYIYNITDNTIVSKMSMSATESSFRHSMTRSPTAFVIASCQRFISRSQRQDGNVVTAYCFELFLRMALTPLVTCEYKQYQGSLPIILGFLHMTYKRRDNITYDPQRVNIVRVRQIIQ